MTGVDRAQRRRTYAQMGFGNAKSWELVACTICHRTTRDLPQTTFMTGEEKDAVCSRDLDEWALQRINHERQRADLTPFADFDALRDATTPVERRTL